MSKGLSAKELPKKVEECEKALKKYASMHDGKLLKQFDRVYNELHIAGYYRGLLKGVDTVNDAIKAAKDFINKIRLK